MAGGPPNLARKSAPPPMHGASAVQRYLQRASSGSPPPVSPRVGTPRAGGLGQVVAAAAGRRVELSVPAAPCLLCMPCEAWLNGAMLISLC